MDNFNWRLQKGPKWKAGIFLVWDVLSSIRFLKSAFIHQHSIVMIRSFVKTSARSIAKNRMSSFISVFSLVLGLTFSMSILTYTAGERSWDSYIKGGEDKYRLTYEIHGVDGLNSRSATSPSPYAPLFAANIPEIQSFIRFTQVRNCLISNAEVSSVDTDQVAFGDSDILTFFGIKMLEGNDDFHDEKSILISRSLAISLFGKSNVVGSLLDFNGIQEFEIKGVFEDFPNQSTVSLDFIGPMDFMQVISPGYYQNGNNWGGYAYHTYFDLKENPDLRKLEDNFRSLYYERFQIDPENLPSEYSNFGLINVSDVHLSPDMARELTSSNDLQRIQLLEYLAYIIVIIGWINFINIQTARAPERYKEIGIRKTLGAFTKDLRVMFGLEFMLMNFGALVTSIMLVRWVTPLLSLLGETSISEPVFNTPLVVFITIGILLSSVYPAIQVTHKSGSRSIAGHKKGYSFLRNTMVVAQFSVTIFLIVYALVINFQVRHLSEQYPGFDSSQVLVIDGPISQNSYIAQRAERFKQQLLSMPGVAQVSSAGVAPGINKGWEGNCPSFDGDNSRFLTSYFSNITDDFFKVFDLEVLAGRIPDSRIQTEHPRVVINRQAAEGYGWEIENAIGKKVGYTDTAVVSGVVENFNSVGFQEAVSPMIFIIDHVYHPRTINDYFLIQVNGSLSSQTLAEAEKLYEELFPTNPFNYSFADELFQKNYTEEISYNRKFILFSLLSILLALMGLIGLTIYHTIQKRKEIGIRKVLGSSEFKVVYLFVRQYAILLVVASIISIPITIIFIQKWLDNFASRIQLEISIVIAPIGCLALIAILAVGLISLKAARLNPVEILKEEQNF